MNRFWPKYRRPDPDAKIDSAHIGTMVAQDIRGADFDLCITTTHIRGKGGVTTQHVLECGDALLDLTPELIQWLMEELMLLDDSFRVGRDPLPVVKNGSVTALLHDEALIQAELERCKNSKGDHA